MLVLVLYLSTFSSRSLVSSASRFARRSSATDAPTASVIKCCSTAACIATQPNEGCQQTAFWIVGEKPGSRAPSNPPPPILVAPCHTNPAAYQGASSPETMLTNNMILSCDHQVTVWRKNPTCTGEKMGALVQTEKVHCAGLCRRRCYARHGMPVSERDLVPGVCFECERVLECACVWDLGVSKASGRFSGCMTSEKMAIAGVLACWGSRRNPHAHTQAIGGKRNQVRSTE